MIKSVFHIFMKDDLQYIRTFRIFQFNMWKNVGFPNFPKKKMAGFPIFHGFPLGQQSDVVLRTVMSFQLHFFLHNLIWTDKCRQHMRIHLIKQNICLELKFSKYLIFFTRSDIFTMNFFSDCNNLKQVMSTSNLI